MKSSPASLKDSSATLRASPGASPGRRSCTVIPSFFARFRLFKLNEFDDINAHR